MVVLPVSLIQITPACPLVILLEPVNPTAQSFVGTVGVTRGRISINVQVIAAATCHRPFAGMVTANMGNIPTPARPIVGFQQSFAAMGFVMLTSKRQRVVPRIVKRHKKTKKSG